MLLPHNNVVSSMNVLTQTQGLVDVTFQSAENVSMPNYHIVVPQQNYHNSLSAVSEGLMRRTNNNIFSSINHIVPYTSTTPIPNKFISEHRFNMVSEGNNILFAENNFDNVVLQVTTALLFFSFLCITYATKLLIECFKLYADGK